MSTHTPRLQESTGTITGPHDGTDKDGDLDHRYWRCQRCGLESIDPRLREGCFRCESAVARGSARDGHEEPEDAPERRDGRVEREHDRPEVERG